MTKAITINKDWTYLYVLSPDFMEERGQCSQEEAEQIKQDTADYLKNFNFEQSRKITIEDGLMPETIYVSPAQETADALLREMENFFLTETDFHGDRPGIPLKIEGSKAKMYTGLLMRFVMAATKRKRFHPDTAVQKNKQGEFVIQK